MYRRKPRSLGLETGDHFVVIVLEVWHWFACGKDRGERLSQDQSRGQVGGRAQWRDMFHRGLEVVEMKRRNYWQKNRRSWRQVSDVLMQVT